MPKASSKKSNSSSASKANNKLQVVSFRLTRAQLQNLVDIVENDAIVGIKSSKTLARKIVVDFIAGRLEYKDPQHKLVDMDSR